MAVEDKSIDLSRPVYGICTEHPEIRELMISLGFKELANPAMFNTAARFVTIPKGAETHGIDLELVKQRIRALGFVIREP